MADTRPPAEPSSRMRTVGARLGCAALGVAFAITLGCPSSSILPMEGCEPLIFTLIAICSSMGICGLGFANLGGKICGGLALVMMSIVTFGLLRVILE